MASQQTVCVALGTLQGLTPENRLQDSCLCDSYPQGTSVMVVVMFMVITWKGSCNFSQEDAPPCFNPLHVQCTHKALQLPTDTSPCTVALSAWESELTAFLE